MSYLKPCARLAGPQEAREGACLRPRGAAVAHSSSTPGAISARLNHACSPPSEGFRRPFGRCAGRDGDVPAGRDLGRGAVCEPGDRLGISGGRRFPPGRRPCGVLRPQAVNGVCATLRGSCRRAWSAGFPRCGRTVGAAGGDLGKNGARPAVRPYPGCAHQLSTGCGFCGRRCGRVETGGVSGREGFR